MEGQRHCNNIFDSGIPLQVSNIQPQLETQAVPAGTRDWLTALHLSSFIKQLLISFQTHRPYTEF